MFVGLKLPFLRYQCSLILLLILLLTPFPLRAAEKTYIFNPGEIINDIHYPVNMQYKYDVHDVYSILTLRATEAKLDPNKTILIYPLPNQADQIEKRLQEEQTSYAERVSKKEIIPEARTVLVPIHINNAHWVGLIIKLNEYNKILNIQYTDSLGDSIFEDSIPDEIRSPIKKVYGKEICIENLMLSRQTDGMADGILVVENLISAAQKNFNLEIIHEELTKLIRNHHINLLELFQPALQFNIKQKDANREYSINETKTGRIIFLLGTSTAGKSSIADYLKNKAQLKNRELVIVSSDSVGILQMLYSYLRYAPSKLNFLHHYLTNEEIFSIVMNPEPPATTVNKMNITAEEKTDIQAILDELRMNEAIIKQKFYSRSQSPYFYSLPILSTLLTGKTIIADAIYPDEFLQSMASTLLSYNMDTVIVYCPPKQLMERLYKRNEAAFELKHFNSSRLGTFPLEQYTQLYEPTVIATQAIDNLTLADIEIPQTIPNMYKKIFIHIKQLPVSYDENQWAEIADLMQCTFGLHTNEDRTWIKPTYNYRLVVNTAQDSAEKCGERILSELHILE